MNILEKIKKNAEISPALQKVIKKQKNPKAIASKYDDIHRIMRLPIVSDMTQEELEQYNYLNLQASHYQEGFRVFPTVANAVLTYELTGGGFFPIGVGFGKTLTSLMIAHKAWAKGIKKMLLLVPPEVMAQLTQNDIKWARERVVIDYPIHVLRGVSAKGRKLLCESGKKGLYIMPYSYLSVKDTFDMLTGIAPKLVIGDEAHKLISTRSARTKRLALAVKEFEPDVVLLSGTITKKGVMDYHHLSKWSCGEDNFLPNTATIAHDWSSILDAQATAKDEFEAPEISRESTAPLINWAESNYPDEIFDQTIESFRRAYSYRMITSPRVVSSGDTRIGTSLIFSNHKITDYKKHPKWKELEGHIKKINDEWETPAGDLLNHAMQTWKWNTELTAGFYNQQTWPSVDKLAKRKKITKEKADEILEKSQWYHEVEQEYASLLRKFLKYKSKPHLDTPNLVGTNMSQHGADYVGHELYSKWKEHKDLEFKGRIKRDKTAIRVCDYKVKKVVQWAMERVDKGKIIWYDNKEVGRWILDLLKEIGERKNCLYCPAGNRANQEIIKHEHKDKTIIASIWAHGTGKNLQHFEEQIFVQWPRPAQQAEQTVGRTHRNGQKADELIVHTLNTTEHDHMNFAACLNDSLYIHQTTRTTQKLIYATYDPPPVIFPSAVLHERGLGNVILNTKQEQELRDKFN